MANRFDDSFDHDNRIDRDIEREPALLRKQRKTDPDRRVEDIRRALGWAFVGGEPKTGKTDIARIVTATVSK